MSEEIKEELEDVFIEDEDFLEELSKWDKKEAEKIEEENQKKIAEEKEIENKKQISNKIKKVLDEAIAVKEIRDMSNNIEIIPKYLFTFTSVNNYEEVKKSMDNYFKIEEIEKTEELLEEYFDTKTKEVKEIEKGKETIINDLQLNNLKCNFTINNIKYTFTFTEDKIYMLNNSNSEELETDYNLDICSLIFGNINNNSIIYKKNENGLSIASLMLRNNINKGTKKGSLCYAFQQYINNHLKIEINELLLITVCEAGNIDMFKYLFLNYRELFNENMLSAACFGGNTEIIRILIQEGFKINYKTLQRACAGNDIRVIDFLMDNYYPEFNLENIDNIINLFEVIKNPDIFSIFLNKMKELIKDPEIISNVFDKINKNNTKKYTKEEKEQIVKNHLYSRLLLETVIGNHLGIVYFLVEETEKGRYKINNNLIENRKDINTAAVNGSLDMFKFLISKEIIDLNKRYECDNNILHYAAATSKNPEILEFLISQSGMDINTKNNAGSTPLTCAIAGCNREAVEILLSYPKIDINAKIGLGSSQIEIATLYGDTEIVKLLLSDKRLKIEENSLMQELQRASEQNQEIAEGLEIYNRNQIEKQKNINEVINEINTKDKVCLLI